MSPPPPPSPSPGPPLSPPPPPPRPRPRHRAALLCGTNELDLSTAATLLRTNRLVAFPTETVYGLGANAQSAPAVAAIFAAKRRPPDNPLIVHLAGPADLRTFALTPHPLPPLAARLIAAFWPGPLTLVLPLDPAARLAPAVSAGLSSVAVRVPQHPVASALLARARVPVAAPSANLSGRPSPTSSAHVLTDLGAVVDAVVSADDDAAAAITAHRQPGGKLHKRSVNCGLESTVVDLTTTEPVVLRPGAISVSALEAVAGVPVKRLAPLSTSQQLMAPKAPGMKYRHYAPNAPLHLVSPIELDSAVLSHLANKSLVGILADDAVCASWRQSERVVCVSCGPPGDTHAYARRLYAALRAFDGEQDADGNVLAATGDSDRVGVILAVPPDDVENGVGEAVLNRLLKAAVAGTTTFDGLK